MHIFFVEQGTIHPPRPPQKKRDHTHSAVNNRIKNIRANRQAININYKILCMNYDSATVCTLKIQSTSIFQMAAPL